MGSRSRLPGCSTTSRQDDGAAIPILSKLPIIGALFKSKATRAEQTELMVLITPRLVRPLNPDEVPTLPTSIRPFIKKGDIGQQLEGGGGVVDAPSRSAGQEDERQRTAENSHDCITPSTRRWTRNERGAVLIQVAVALLALLALSSFVFDYGVMWVSRGQAQTSADAGALSGAISLAFDSATDQNAARAKAIALARQNRVWAQAPDITNADVTFPPCPPGAPGLPDTCIKVDVFRNQRAGGNPLPVFFSRLVGLTNQGVRATATAQIITGDTTDCLKPWAILDRWDEYNAATNGAEAEYPNPDPDFLPSSTFDRYSTGQGSSPPQENDLYVRPSPGPTVRRAPVSGCLRTRAVSSGSRWTRIRARPCPPVGSAPFACRAWMVRTAATFTGTTSRLAAACRRATPRRAPCVPRISGTTTWRIGPSVGATRPSPATRSVRRGRVSKPSSLAILAPPGERTASPAVRSAPGPRARASFL